MQISPYLIFNGNCREAFTFYADLFGATIGMMQSFGESPMAEHMPPELQHLIMHANISVDGQVLMGSDAPPERYEGKPHGFSVSLSFTSVEDAERFYNGLAEGGSVEMPLQETFWAARFGMLTDRFDIAWMINCDKAA